VKKIFLSFLTVLIFLTSFAYAQNDRYETKIVFVPDESKKSILHELDDNDKKSTDYLLERQRKELEGGDFYIHTDTDLGIQWLDGDASTDSKMLLEFVGFKKIELDGLTYAESELLYKKRAEYYAGLANGRKKKFTASKKEIKSMTNNINEITLRGWEIKTTRRAHITVQLFFDNTTEEKKIWGTEYTLQRKADAANKKPSK